MGPEFEEGRSEENILSLWYNSCVLCADHFKDNQFMNSDKNSLVWNAVLTVFNVPNPPPKVICKRPLQTPRDHIPWKKPKLEVSPIDIE